MVKGILKESPDLLNQILCELKAGKTAKEISALTGVKVKRIFFLSSKLLKPEDKINPFVAKYQKAIEMRKSGNFSLAEISEIVGINTTSLKQRFKLEGIRATSEQALANFERRTGFKRHTFGDVRKVCQKNSLELISDEDDDKLIYDVTQSGHWKFKCLWPKKDNSVCGNIISSRLADIYSEITKSCGCRDIQVATARFVAMIKYTYGDVRKILKESQLELISDEPDDKSIENVTNQKVDVKCWCKNIFQSYLSNLYSKNTKSCGCLKSNPNYIRQNIAKRTKYIFKDVLKACEINGFKFLADVNPEDKIYNTSHGNWNVECFCGRIYQPDIGDLIYLKVRSCGCIKSKPQKDIHDFINGLDVGEIEFNARGLIRCPVCPSHHILELDIYVPNKGIAIEYNGLWCHSLSYLESELKKRGCDISPSKYHAIKERLCREKGIKLITIFEPEWLENNSGVKSYLRAIFGAKTQKIGARKCEIKLIPNFIGHKFCNEYHIQGSCSGVGSFCYGLYYKDELIACSFYANKSVRGKSFKDGVWELIRYCVKNDLNIQGGLTKIQAKFILDCKPHVIISVSDNRWSQGKIYKACGFEFAGEISPDYSYFKKGTQGPLKYKTFGMKSNIKNRSPDIYSVYKTENQMMQEAGYDRIFDCGKIKWVLKII